MESNNKKKKNNYYKYHNNHNNQSNKQFYYYKNKKKNKKQNINTNNQHNQQKDNILLNQEQNKQIENVLINQEQSEQQDTLVKQEQLQQNTSQMEVSQELTPRNNQIEETREFHTTQLQKTLSESGSSFDEVDFKPVRKDEQEEMPTKKNFLKYAVGFALLVIVMFGVSYSFFTYRKEDSRQGDIASGEVYVTLQEQAVSMTLNRMYPRTLEEARARNDNYIDFTLKAKNTSDTKAIYYKLNISNGEDVSGKTRINPQYLLIDLQEKVGNEYTFVKEAVPLSSFKFQDVIPENTTSEVTKEYRIRIWVSDAIIISDTEENATYTQAQFNNLYGNISVYIESFDGEPPAPTAVEVISAVQGLETTPYGKVYTGIMADNYVWFNNEQWRIIGVYTDDVNGDMLKIIRSNPLPDAQQCQESVDDGNSWPSSFVQTYLYDTYYPTLSEDARNMIVENASWNIGPSTMSANASEAYADAIEDTWTGKIGLTASYEYLHAGGNASWTTPGNTSGFWTTWLNTVINSGSNHHGWSITADSANSNNVLRFSGSASINSVAVTTSYSITPVVYLKPEVTITGGDGHSGEANSYKLGLSE